MATSKLLEPIKVCNLTLKNRIMFPLLTTGYEERDGSIGPRSLAFYERLAKGGVSYIVRQLGDVAPVNAASPTPKLCDDSQMSSFAALADAVHAHGAKLALQLFHPEYDVPGVGRLIMTSRVADMEGQKAHAALPTLGVAVKLGHQPTTDELNAFDAVIVAVGAENVFLPVPGTDGANVFSAWDVLAGTAEPAGKVAVIGGGLVGSETAEYLLARGC